MAILYHFAMSPFSRRTRLALAHKGVVVELREARVELTYRAEAKAKHPLETIPVLVDDGGEVVGDSRAIVDYLDRTRPGAPLWPADRAELARALEVVALVDGALNLVVDLGTRYWALREHEAWTSVKATQLGRAQAALDLLGRIVGEGGPTICASGWGAADIWLYAFVAWLEGLPARAPTNANVANVLSLGWTLPAALSRWADVHRDRGDVRALDAM